MSRTSHCRLLAAAMAVLVLSFLPTSAGATAQHAAGLVIDTGERVVTVYVEFPEGEDTITGEELLVLADVDAEFADYGSMGKAVCSILGVGSPKEDCFREAERNGLYWNYSRARDGEWERSSRGVSQTTVEHGDVDGWAWGEQGSQPPYHSFEDIRAQHASEASPSPTPTPSPTDEAAPPAGTEGSPVPTATAATTPQTATGEEEPETAGTETAPAGTDATATPPPSPDATAPTADPDAAVGRDAPAADPTPSSSATAPVVATGGTAAADRGPLPLVAFLLVLGGLVGTIAWRRVRSG